MRQLNKKIWPISIMVKYGKGGTYMKPNIPLVDMKTWLDDNGISHYLIERSGHFEYAFRDNEDAMMFKLRWV